MQCHAVWNIGITVSDEIGASIFRQKRTKFLQGITGRQGFSQIPTKLQGTTSHRIYMYVCVCAYIYTKEECRIHQFFLHSFLTNSFWEVNSHSAGQQIDYCVLKPLPLIPTLNPATTLLTYFLRSTRVNWKVRITQRIFVSSTTFYSKQLPAQKEKKKNNHPLFHMLTLTLKHFLQCVMII